MTLKLYTDMAAESLRLIAKFGQSVTVMKSSPNLGRDLVNGSRTGSRTAVQYKGLVADDGGKLFSDVRMIGNASIMTTDTKIIFGPDVDIIPDDTIIHAGIERAILKIIVTKPADVKLLTTVWLRR